VVKPSRSNSGHAAPGAPHKAALCSPFVRQPEMQHPKPRLETARFLSKLLRYWVSSLQFVLEPVRFFIKLLRLDLELLRFVVESRWFVLSLLRFDIEPAWFLHELL
jgi:hypothetical protein